MPEELGSKAPAAFIPAEPGNLVSQDGVAVMRVRVVLPAALAMIAAWTAPASACPTIDSSGDVADGVWTVTHAPADTLTFIVECGSAGAPIGRRVTAPSAPAGELPAFDRIDVGTSSSADVLDYSSPAGSACSLYCPKGLQICPALRPSKWTSQGTILRRLSYARLEVVAVRSWYV